MYLLSTPQYYSSAALSSIRRYHTTHGGWIILSKERGKSYTELEPRGHPANPFGILVDETVHYTTEADLVGIAPTISSKART